MAPWKMHFAFGTKVFGQSRSRFRLRPQRDHPTTLHALVMNDLGLISPLRQQTAEQLARGLVIVGDEDPRHLFSRLSLRHGRAMFRRGGRWRILRRKVALDSVASILFCGVEGQVGVVDGHIYIRNVFSYSADADTDRDRDGQLADRHL